MIHFIQRLIRSGLKRRGISLIAAYLAVLIFSSILIQAVEPAGSDLTHFDTALWWSIVTSTTVGYGDLFPVSNFGKIVAVVLPMFMGIGIGAAFITYLASLLIERRDKKMHGEKDYTDSRHILILGFANETEQLVDEIRNDETYSQQDIVLTADIDRHPFSQKENVFFIKGRPDTPTTLKKANIKKASRIIIHTGSDEASLFALINALKHKNETCEITVRCINSQSLDTFSSVRGDFQIIMQMTAEMMVQAMQDKVHLPLQILLKNDSGDEIYYVHVPDVDQGLTWWPLHIHFKEKHNYLSFAMQTSNGQTIINPDHHQSVEQGDGIWLIAAKRPIHITWPA